MVVLLLKIEITFNTVNVIIKNVTTFQIIFGLK
jgi:hypothetical protein